MTATAPTRSRGSVSTVLSWLDLVRSEIRHEVRPCVRSSAVHVRLTRPNGIICGPIYVNKPCKWPSRKIVNRNRQSPDPMGAIPVRAVVSSRVCSMSVMMSVGHAVSRTCCSV